VDLPIQGAVALLATALKVPLAPVFGRFSTAADCLETLTTVNAARTRQRNMVARPS